MQLKNILNDIFDELEMMSEIRPESIDIKAGELIFIKTGNAELSRFIAQNVILEQIRDQQDLPILVFCPSIPINQYVRQLLSIKSKVDYFTISFANPAMEQSGWDRLSRAVDDLSNSSVLITDQKYHTFEQLKIRIEKAHYDMPLGLIVTDNMEFPLLGTSVLEAEDDYKKSLKSLSKTLNIPIVVCNN
jgi:replicative DNA helicase